MVTGQTYPQYYPNYPNYPQYQAYQPVQQAIQQPTQNNTQNLGIMAWVQSEEEGIKYPLSTGQSIFLMNQNADYLYMKSVDQLGKTTFIKKKLVDETDSKEPQIDLSGYIRKDEIEDLINEKVQEEVEKRVSEISFRPTKPKRKSDLEED